MTQRVGPAAPRWIDKAEAQLADDHAAGLISTDEYNAQLRDMHRERQAEADEAAEAARRDVLGGW